MICSSRKRAPAKVLKRHVSRQIFPYPNVPSSADGPSEVKGILFNCGNCPACQLGNVPRKPVKGYRFLVRFPREFVFGNIRSSVFLAVVISWSNSGINRSLSFIVHSLFHSLRVLSSL